MGGEILKWRNLSGCVLIERQESARKFNEIGRICAAGLILARLASVDKVFSIFVLATCVGEGGNS